MFMHINCVSFYVSMLLPRPRRGLRGNVFTLSVCVCPANMLVFYFSAIRRDINLKFIGLHSIH